MYKSKGWCILNWIVKIGGVENMAVRLRCAIVAFVESMFIQLHIFMQYCYWSYARPCRAMSGNIAFPVGLHAHVITPCARTRGKVISLSICHCCCRCYPQKTEIYNSQRDVNGTKLSYWTKNWHICTRTCFSRSTCVTNCDFIHHTYSPHWLILLS